MVLLAGATADVMAEIALLVASVFYAISGVYGRRFGRAGLAPMVTATGSNPAASFKERATRIYTGTSSCGSGTSS